jgi:hypothetical protein
VPWLAYDDLEIQEGMIASFQFYRMAFDATDEIERARLRSALLKYCERDTHAMVEISKALRDRARCEVGGGGVISAGASQDPGQERDTVVQCCNGPMRSAPQGHPWTRFRN